MTIERNHSRDSSSSRTIEEQQDENRPKDPMNDSPIPQKQLLQWWSDKEDLKVRTKLDFRIMPL